MNADVIELVWRQLLGEIGALKTEGHTARMRSERAETAGGVESVVFARLPRAINGATGGDQLFVSNGRKAGEAAGAGTGVMAYYNPSTDMWNRFSDDTAVSI